MSNQLSFSLDFFAPTERSSRLGPGIHKVTFTSIQYDPTGNYTDIVFTNDTGTANKRIFHEAKVYGNGTIEEAVETRNARNLGFYYSVLSVVGGKGATSKVPVASNYDALARATEAALSKYKGKEVYLKLIVDKNGVYSEIPKYGRFIQSVDEELTLTISEKESTVKAPVRSVESDLPF